ncbi:MAG TPA: modification methylase [Desulfotomaculum sp.]|nr:modification methylase [Desulfotomaculum sp.]
MESNEELINFYQVLRDDLDSLLVDLRRHENTAEYYYKIRSAEPETLTSVQRASRLLYLNKTAYNGLWRVNRKGWHNVPFGRYKNPRIIDEDNLLGAHWLLQRARIKLADFSVVLETVRPGMFVYLDPPYYPLSKTSGFTSYTADSFSENDQCRLAEVFRQLDHSGCLIMLSNSDNQLIRELYKGYDIKVVMAKRAINCRADRRGPIAELVIRNYEL